MATITNHISLNLVTKGIFDAVALVTKGMIILSFEIVLRKRGGSSPGPTKLAYQEEEEYYKKLRELKEEDIDYIKVNVNWNIQKSHQIMEAKLMTKKIEAEFFENDNSILNSSLKNILGLNESIFRLSNHVYDLENRLTSVSIKVYNNENDRDDDINEFASYNMDSSYNSDGILTNYRITKN